MRFPKWVVSFSICLLLTGCELPHNQTTQQDAGPRQTISAALTRWNQKQPIRLQKHQLIPIDYLEKNPNIKGLIVNHYLGTGKTFLAIGFAERNPDRSVIILGPKFLHSHWLEQLDKYGVKDKSRYQFISHDAPETFLKVDTSNAIILLDESHRFIERVRAQTTQSDLYSQAYFKTRQAHRILSLTGTPIYNDTFDLIYQINLVSGKNIFPFNLQQVRLQFAKINKFNAYWRGHLLENEQLNRFLSLGLTPFAMAYFNLTGAQTVSLFFSVQLALLLTQVATLPHQYPLRDFNPEALKNAVTQYISYYNFDHDARFYPAHRTFEEKLHYNERQLNFLYKLYDYQLSDSEITQLLKDDAQNTPHKHFHKENLELNQTLIQEKYASIPGAGRVISNLLFTDQRDKTQKIIFPEKFHRILSTVKQSRGPAIVYSHYYYNGLLLFKQFLDASGYQNQYKIFHPEMSKEQHTEIIEAFNANKIKILLLHPDITEGISLKGTRQLHFLDIPINSALQNQIIGRAIRYRSHMHLPKSEQHVDVYVWKYVISFFNTSAWTSVRENWHYNFSEFQFSSDSRKRYAADHNAIKKSESPDVFAYYHLHTITRSIERFKQYTRDFSIENTMYGMKEETVS